ncbi:MAG: PKD domain-containing protein, partial [Flavobacteriales bacterium]|nr:PKD domain-containing protein [Flavobacteriales bacterium]
MPSPADGSNLPPSAGFTSNTISIPVGGTVDFTDLSTNNPTSWLWLLDGGSPGSSFNQNPTGVQYNLAGMYDAVLITSNANGSDTITKIGYISVGGTGISDLNQNTILDVFPNPTEDIITVVISELNTTVVEIYIYNAIGQVVYSNKVAVSNGVVSEEISLTTFGSGVYQLAIQSSEGVLKRKVVVK